MNEAEYASICAFVQKHSGIVLGENKAYLIESRLEPVVQKFELGNVSNLARQLTLAAPDLRQAVVDAMTTNESFFFRDTTPFTAFEQTILPALAKARRTTGRIRIWCAAASTGQEPYSLAMILSQKKHLWAGLQVEIIGTDLSTHALERAKQGRYTQFEVQRGLPVQLLVAYFRQEGSAWVISDEIKRMVRFSQQNLLQPLAALGTMDVVFCRNVLIYFDVATKAKVLSSIRSIMRPDSYLVLGAAETLMGITDSFGKVEGSRGLYQPVGAAQMTA